MCLGQRGLVMIKAIKTLIFAVTVSSILVFNGMAQNGGYWQDKPKQDKKPKEKVEEKKKEDRSGEKKDDKKKEKKPDDESV